MWLVEKIINGGHRGRKTRLHDAKGNFVGWGNFVNAPKAVTSGVVLKLCGFRSEVPWISYRATSILDQLIQPDWRILEFGSGMSTHWFAKRCSFLHSIECDELWYQKVNQVIRQKARAELRYDLRTTESTYCDISEYEDGYFDFVMVDGAFRSHCVINAIAKVKPGGWFYLDNCDIDPHLERGDTRIAEETLVEASKQRGGELRYFTDFVPGCFFVNQGVLARL